MSPISFKTKRGEPVAVLPPFRYPPKILFFVSLIAFLFVWNLVILVPGALEDAHLMAEANYHRKMGRRDEAIASYREILAKIPRSKEAALNLSKTLLEEGGHFAEVVSLLEPFKLTLGEKQYFVKRLPPEYGESVGKNVLQ